jgi:UrcA family protein
MKTFTLTVSAALAAALLAGPAIAADDLAGPSVEVRYHDLDLTTVEGTDELDRRLDKAAKSVCGIDEISTGTRLNSREARACYKETRGQLESRFAAVVAKKERG